MFGGPPNITGSFDVVQNTKQVATGAFGGSFQYGFRVGGGNSVYWGTISYSASRSNRTYGGSTTVQSPSVLLLAVIKT